MFNLINFIDTTIKNKDLRNFGIYCHKVFKHYNENIVVFWCNSLFRIVKNYRLIIECYINESFALVMLFV